MEKNIVIIILLAVQYLNDYINCNDHHTENHLDELDYRGNIAINGIAIANEMLYTVELINKKNCILHTWNVQMCIIYNVLFK